MSRARVLVLNSALGPLDYRVPAGMAVEPGSIVVAPLGPRQLLGVAWEPEFMPSETEVGDNRLRPLLAVADVPPLGAALRRLVEWTAGYYLAPPASVVRMCLASTSALEGARTVTEYRATGEVPPRLTPQREQALQRIGDRQGLIRELAAVADVSDAVIRGLAKCGAIEAVAVDIDSPYPRPDPAHGQPSLSAEQQDAADTLVAGVAARTFRPTLLDGVTGSGKTEVYFEAVAEAIRGGRQTIALLPEIALTEPFLKRFHDRFGCEPVAWAFGPAFDAAAPRLAGDRERRGAGDGRRAIGAVPALPRSRPDRRRRGARDQLKQEEGVHYHARDVAVMRGLFEECPVILASATPAIETRQQVALGRYAELRLPARFGTAELPRIEAIDLIEHPPERGRWLAPRLVEAIGETLARREQAPAIPQPPRLCAADAVPDVRAPFPMPQLHRVDGRAPSHPPPRLPSLRPCRAGAAAMPGVQERGHAGRVRPGRRADRGRGDRAVSRGEGRGGDVGHDLVARQGRRVRRTHGRGRHRHRRRHAAGDQGLSFSQPDAGRVVDADLGLEGGDLRAAERTFQQIRQVSGRAGRGEKPGHVYIQTHSPKAQVMQALITGDADAFYAAETDARKDAGAPPFGRYAAIVVSSEDQACAHEIAVLVGRSAPQVEGMAVYGPAPAPLAMLRGRHRYRLLVHARRALDVQDVIRDWLGALNWPAKVRVTWMSTRIVSCDDGDGGHPPATFATSCRAGSGIHLSAY